MLSRSYYFKLDNLKDCYDFLSQTEQKVLNKINKLNVLLKNEQV